MQRKTLLTIAAASSLASLAMGMLLSAQAQAQDAYPY